MNKFFSLNDMLDKCLHAVWWCTKYPQPQSAKSEPQGVACTPFIEILVGCACTVALHMHLDWLLRLRQMADSGNLLNYLSINSVEFKHPLSHTCLAGVVVASWSLTQEVASLNILLL